MKNEIKSKSPFYDLAMEFRDWNRQWSLYDKGVTFKQPSTNDEFISQMEKEYKVTRKKDKKIKAKKEVFYLPFESLTDLTMRFNAVKEAHNNNMSSTIKKLDREGIPYQCFPDRVEVYFSLVNSDREDLTFGYNGSEIEDVYKRLGVTKKL